MGYHRHILIKFDDGNTRILRGVEAATPEQVLKELEFRFHHGHEMWVFDSVNKQWILIPPGGELPPPPLKVHLRRNGEPIIMEGYTGGKKGKLVGGLPGQAHAHLHGDGGDEDIYKILGNQRPPGEAPMPGLSSGRRAPKAGGKPGWMAGEFSGENAHGQTGSPLASGYKSSYEMAHPQDPRVNYEPNAINPNNPHYPTPLENMLMPPAFNPNNPGYRNNPKYNPRKNHALLSPRRQHWVEHDLRKDRQGVLPWGGDPQLHNSPAGGGDNTELRRLDLQRDRNLAVFQHQAAFKRQQI